MRENTQHSILLRHFKDFGAITAFEAVIEYGILQLHPRIFELREKGYIIADEWVYKDNRYGEPIKFKKYRLIGQLDLFE